MTESVPPEQDDERELAALLRKAAPRAEPSAHAREAARTAVEAAWRESLTPANDAPRRQAWPWAIAASLIMASLALVVVMRVEDAGPVVATIERVRGPTTLTSGLWWSRDARAADGQALRKGVTLETGASSLAMVEWSPSLAIRVAPATSVQVQDSGELLLRYGRVYIDAREGAAALRVITPQGAISHVGTQYEIGVSGRTVAVAVRSGAVVLEHSAESRRVDAGQQLRVDAEGRGVVASIAPTDARWRWIGALPLRVDIEGMLLPAFLQWYVRETGRHVRFANAEIEVAMRGVELHGSVEGLSVDDALRTVLASSGLEADVRVDEVELTRAR